MKLFLKLRTKMALSTKRSKSNVKNRFLTLLSLAHLDLNLKTNMKRWTNVWLCQRALKKNLASLMMTTTIKILQSRCNLISNFHRIRTLIMKKTVMKRTKNAEPKKKDKLRSKEFCTNFLVKDVTILFLVSSVLSCTLRRTRKNFQLYSEPTELTSRRLYLNLTNSVKDNILVSMAETTHPLLSLMVPKLLRI